MEHLIVRKLVKDKIMGNSVEKSHELVVNQFTYYLEAYCSELKFTDWEIVHDDEHFEKVWGIYKSIKHLN